jgi:hypothetical protein
VLSGGGPEKGLHLLEFGFESKDSLMDFIETKSQKQIKEKSLKSISLELERLRSLDDNRRIEAKRIY